MSQKNPTNNDIYRKLDNMDVRILNLESWKIAEDAARKAVTDYKQHEDERRRGELYQKESKSKREIFKQVSYILGLIILILYIYLSSKGIRV